jgi:hypothetical protein
MPEFISEPAAARVSTVVTGRVDLIDFLPVNNFQTSCSTTLPAAMA